jgi:hypothetical protein
MGTNPPVSGRGLEADRSSAPRQRAKQELVDDTENGEVGADADNEDEQL